MRLQFQTIGLAGCRIEVAGQVLCIDPDWHTADINLRGVNWVLFTHAPDDADSRSSWAGAASWVRFVGPAEVLRRLRAQGVPEDRLHLASTDWTTTIPGIELRATPAARPAPDREPDGLWRSVGYLLRLTSGTLYFSGDTCLFDELLTSLQGAGPIHTAILPVNEANHFAPRPGGYMSVREAFGLANRLGVAQVIPVARDRSASTGTSPDEIRLLHCLMGCQFNLLIYPTGIHIGRAKASVIVRTLNESRYLDQLLQAIARQDAPEISCEVVLVDSGSTDGTLEIAERHGCRIVHIAREEFSFGRSLNRGCGAATGDVLVITSGHCVPVANDWLQRLCTPLLEGVAQVSYGKQLGGEESHFSECRVFAKYFPDQSRVPQDGFYCNNANAAILKSTWERYRYNEALTGLEDMELAQRLVRDGGRVAYVAEAPVWHHHQETWAQVRRRFEREAIALQQIMPNVHVSWTDTLRYTASSIWADWRHAWRAGCWRRHAWDIARYRYHQYTGSWRGNHDHRRLSQAEKDEYFYPH